MKARVPERATVPRLSISSCRSMPMPLSAMVSVPAALSGVMRIASGAPSPSEFRLGDRLVAQPVAGIRGVGNQLAQEDVGLGIDRVHHQPQQLGDFGLERMGFGGLSGLHVSVGHVSAWISMETNRTGYSGRAALPQGFRSRVAAEHDAQIVRRHRDVRCSANPCAAASAATSSRSRTPHAGSRALRLSSNAALLGAVCCPCWRYGP